MPVYAGRLEVGVAGVRLAALDFPEAAVMMLIVRADLGSVKDL
jgi:hypothetical protein